MLNHREGVVANSTNVSVGFLSSLKHMARVSRIYENCTTCSDLRHTCKLQLLPEKLHILIPTTK